MPSLPTDAAPRVKPLHWGHLPLLLRQLVAQQDAGGGARVWRQALVGPLQRLIGRSGTRRPADLGLVAFDPSDQPVGLLLAGSANRRGSCWRLDLLQISEDADGRLDLATALLREALHRTPAAVSWIARADLHDELLLAALRDQGFQTLQQLQVWRVADLDHLQSANQPLPEGLELLPLQADNAALLLQLELSATPSQLRRMQDLSSPDLLDEALPASRLLVDRQRHLAVAAARLQRRRHGQQPMELDLTLHPAWEALLEGPMALLLGTAIRDHLPVVLRCDGRRPRLIAWLAHQGALQVGEELVLARSLWARQALATPSWRRSATLDRLVGPWRPGQRPVPEAVR
jgi:hypothetical protein